MMAAFRTIPQMFFAQAERLGERRMLLAKREGVYREMRWSEVRQAVEELALYLLEDGVVAGDRVVILSENRPEWLMADVAAQSIQAVSVPIYPTNTAAEIAHITNDCAAVAMVISTEAQLDKVLSVRDRLPKLRRLIVAESLVFPESAGIVSLGYCLEQGAKLRPQRIGALRHALETGRPEALATLIYTSGTTGEPKGVMLSHANFLSNCAAASEALPITEEDVHLSFLPLSHVFERMAGFYLMVRQGATIAFAEDFDHVPSNLLEVRPTLILGVPRFYEKLHARVTAAVHDAPRLRRRIFAWALSVGKACEQERQTRGRLPARLRLARAIADRLVYRTLHQRLGGRVRFCASGSAPLAREIAEFFASVGVLILEGYGLTETSPVISVNRLDSYRFGSVGRPVSGVEVRIAEDGEILTRGPHVMQGYFGKDAATKEAIVDGWFHTGDIGRVDEAGFLYITDRKKDLIKTAGGKMVAPQKIEGLLVSDPYIAQAFVFGDRQRYLVALLVPHWEAVQRFLLEQGIRIESKAAMATHERVRHLFRERIDACSKDLAPFEQIKQFAVLEHEWSQATGELTPTMKARRSVLADKHRALLEQLYAAAPHDARAA